MVENNRLGQCRAFQNGAAVAQILSLNQASNVSVDGARREVRLSALFEWYGQDFGASVEAVLRFIGKYRSDGALLREGTWKVRYFTYDWGINEAK